MKKYTWILITCLGFILHGTVFVVQAEQSVTVCTYGGAWGKLQRKVYFDPFEKQTGIKVIQQFSPKIAKVKAMVMTGNVEWDLFEAADSYRIRLERLGYLEKLDYSYIDPKTLSGFDDYQKKSTGIYYYGYSTAMAYSRDAFPNGGPKNWAEFWDVKSIL